MTEPTAKNFAEQGTSLTPESSSVHSLFSWRSSSSRTDWSLLLWSSSTHWSRREAHTDLGFYRLPGVWQQPGHPCSGMGSRAAVSGYMIPAHGKENHDTNSVSTCMQDKGGNYIVLLSFVLCYNYSSSKFFEEYFKLSLPKQNLVNFDFIPISFLDFTAKWDWFMSLSCFLFVFYSKIAISHA